jgi:sugar lactone lactonase YvrE
MILPAELTAVRANGRIRRSRCAAAYPLRACADNLNRKQQSNAIKFKPTGESHNNMSIEHPFAKLAVGASLLTSLTIYAVGGAVIGHHAFAPAPVVETVALFDPMTPDAPESIVIDHQGNKFISMSLTGEIRKISPDGEQSAHAVLPNGVFSFTPPNPPTGGMTAMALDNDGTIYVNLVASDPANRGVWAVAPNGSIRMLAQLPANALPNGIARRHDVLYVADSVLGVVWKVPTSGGEATIWADHPLLKVGPIPGIPGPNGLQIFHSEVYVSNPGQALIVAIDINPDGTAGAIRTHATGLFCDDFAFDLEGNLYATTGPFNTVLRVAPDGAITTLLTGNDGLDGPTAVAFGRAGGDNFNLYICNAAFPFFSVTHRPSLMKLYLEFPGAPLHN